MAEANCKRELELEIPADNVQKATEKIAKDLARVARVPGFRPGKAPVTLIRRRFADDIQGEVVQSLVPEYLEKALGEKNLIPVTRPEVDKVEFKEGEPLRFRAIFEVLPEFDLGDYKGVEVQVDAVETGDAQVDKTLEELRERRRTFRRRPRRKDGDVLIKLSGTPEAAATIQADNISPLGRRRLSKVSTRTWEAHRQVKPSSSDQSIPTTIPIRSSPARLSTTPSKCKVSKKRSSPT
jgi:hypothetical protein